MTRFLICLTVVLAIAKAAGYLQLPWLMVFMPLGVAILMFGVVMGCLLFISILQAWAKGEFE